MKNPLKQLQQPQIPDPPLPADPIHTENNLHLLHSSKVKILGSKNIACDQKLPMSGEKAALSTWISNSGLFVAAWVSEQTVSMALVLSVH